MLRAGIVSCEQRNGRMDFNFILCTLKILYKLLPRARDLLIQRKAGMELSG